MARLTAWTAAALAGWLCGCSAVTSTEDEAAKLMQTSREWSNAAATGNTEAVLAYFDDEAVMMSEGQLPVRGKKAIGEYLAQTSRIPGFKIEWEPLEAKVSGDLGYIIERTKVTMNGPQGAPVTQHMQALTVWRKQADGSWKNLVDMTTSAAPSHP
jgi:uncharacterized protein (TIGR02246 family)